MRYRKVSRLSPYAAFGSCTAALLARAALNLLRKASAIATYVAQHYNVLSLAIINSEQDDDLKSLAWHVWLDTTAHSKHLNHPHPNRIHLEVMIKYANLQASSMTDSCCCRIQSNRCCSPHSTSSQ